MSQINKVKQKRKSRMSLLVRSFHLFSLCYWVTGGGLLFLPFVPLTLTLRSPGSIVKEQKRRTKGLASLFVPFSFVMKSKK